MILTYKDGSVKLVFVSYSCELYETVLGREFLSAVLDTTGDHTYAVEHFRKRCGRHLKSVSCLGYTFWRSAEDWG